MYIVYFFCMHNNGIIGSKTLPCRIQFNNYYFLYLRIYNSIFPNIFKAKRHVGALDLGRSGGGAPMFSNGKKVTRTCEDPVLRFQFGSKDLRKCVDNNLRYKTNRQQQQEYKKELGM